MLIDLMFVFLNCYAPLNDAGALLSFLCLTCAFNLRMLIYPIKLPLLGATSKLVRSFITFPLEFRVVRFLAIAVAMYPSMPPALVELRENASNLAFTPVGGDYGDILLKSAA